MRRPPEDPRYDRYDDGQSAFPEAQTRSPSAGGKMGARYGGPPAPNSPRLESNQPSADLCSESASLEWRGWEHKDARGYRIRLEQSGDGYRAQLSCVDQQGRGGVLLPSRGPVQNPPPGTSLLSYGGGLLDPTMARALAAALLAYADEREERG